MVGRGGGGREEGQHHIAGFGWKSHGGRPWARPEGSSTTLSLPTGGREDRHRSSYQPVGASGEVWMISQAETCLSGELLVPGS